MARALPSKNGRCSPRIPETPVEPLDREACEGSALDGDQRSPNWLGGICTLYLSDKSRVPVFMGPEPSSQLVLMGPRYLNLSVDEPPRDRTEPVLIKSQVRPPRVHVAHELEVHTEPTVTPIGRTGLTSDTTASTAVYWLPVALRIRLTTRRALDFIGNVIFQQIEDDLALTHLTRSQCSGSESSRSGSYHEQPQTAIRPSFRLLLFSVHDAPVETYV